jgi:hypothetical protein
MGVVLKQSIIHPHSISKLRELVELKVKLSAESGLLQPAQPA